MTEISVKPNVADLRREKNDLLEAVLIEADYRDHWPTGRWPMIHRLNTMIREAEANARN